MASAEPLTTDESRTTLRQRRRIREATPLLPCAFERIEKGVRHGAPPNGAVTRGATGLCRIGGDSSGEWLYCRLIDISMLGLGIYLQHPDPVGLVGRHTTVQVPPFNDAVSFRLEGAIDPPRVGAAKGPSESASDRRALECGAVHGGRPDDG